MKFNKDILEKRRKHLGLNEVNTQKVYSTLIESYKKELIKAPREVVDYSITIYVCNMNYYNRLGKLEELNNSWGDKNFYVDLRNSTFTPLKALEDGELESDLDGINFIDVKELKNIDMVSFSIKEMIELCQRDNYGIILCANGDDSETVLEITPYMDFKMSPRLREYLKTIK